MKRKVFTLFLSTVIAMSAIGCGRANDNKDNTGSVDNTENQGAGTIGSESVMESTENGTESDFNQLQLGNALELPEGFEGAEGETDAHGELEQVIAQHLNIAEEDYQNISYYYNYVDLNGDSKNEILVMVMGERLNQDGGNRLIWLDASGDSLTADSILQEFTGISAPVYISNHMTEGYRDLILCNNIGMNNDITQDNLGTGADDTGATDSNGAGTAEGNSAGTAEGNSTKTAEGNSTKTTEDNSTKTTEGNGAGTTEGNSAGTTENGATGTAAGNEGQTTEGNGAIGNDSDRGRSGYVLLTWKGDKYQEIQEGTVLEDLQGYEGSAIITNDMSRDFREDTYHFLGEAMNL